MQICFTFYTEVSEVIFAHLTHYLFFRWHLIMCHLITDIWWDILNPYMARGWSAFLSIFQKNYKLLEAEAIDFIFVNMIQHPCILKNNILHRNIEHLSKREPPPFFHSDTNLVLGNALVHPFEKNPVLVVTVELVWLLFLNRFFFNFIQTPNKSLRFRKFRRNNVHRPVVIETNHCQSCTAFFAWCALSKVSAFLFLRLFVPNNSPFA